MGFFRQSNSDGHKKNVLRCAVQSLLMQCEVLQVLARPSGSPVEMLQVFRGITASSSGAARLSRWTRTAAEISHAWDGECLHVKTDISFSAHIRVSL